MTDDWRNVDKILADLLRYEEVLGAVALSREGLVVGSAVVSRQDAELVGALGASLVGAAERTARRLGAGVAEGMTIVTADGMIYLRHAGDVAVMLFMEPCDAIAVGEACEATVHRIGEALAVLA